VKQKPESNSDANCLPKNNQSQNSTKSPK